MWSDERLASWRLCCCRCQHHALPTGTESFSSRAMCRNFYLSVIYNLPLTKLDGAAAKSAGETVKMATTSGVGRWPVNYRVALGSHGRPARLNIERPARRRPVSPPSAAQSDALLVGRSLDDFCAGVHFQFISIRLVGLSRLLGVRTQAIRS